MLGRAADLGRAVARGRKEWEDTVDSQGCPLIHSFGTFVLMIENFVGNQDIYENCFTTEYNAKWDYVMEPSWCKIALLGDCISTEYTAEALFRFRPYKMLYN